MKIFRNNEYFLIFICITLLIINYKLISIIKFKNAIILKSIIFFSKKKYKLPFKSNSNLTVYAFIISYYFFYIYIKL